jgi:hypothetical protein
MKPVQPRFFRNWKKLARVQPGWLSLAAVLLLVCLAAYGPALPRLGFYWDDWPWAWLEHLHGPAGMLAIDREFRPLAGPFLGAAALLAGGEPLLWQVLNLGLRWMSALALAWALLQIWPGGRAQAAWAALLFVIYPAFGQQFIPINTSRHLFPLAIAFISLGLMALAVRRRFAGPEQGGREYWLLMGASLLLALAALLTSEYVYGLEFLRPAILWLVFMQVEGEKPEADPRLRAWRRAKRTLWAWLPFAGLLAVILTWRYRVSLSVNYPVTLLAGLAADPPGALAAALRETAGGVLQAVLAAWGRALDFPARGELGLRGLAVYWGLAALVAALVFIFLLRYGASEAEQGRPLRGGALRGGALRGGALRGAALQRLLLGGLALILSCLPFLVTGLPLGLNFPSDRALLPLLFGACLVWAGLLELLPLPRAAKVAALAVAAGLAAGAQFRQGQEFAREWEQQRDFFQQLAWRAPGLQPGTALVTQQLKFDYSSDNSLTAPVNWMYAGAEGAALGQGSPSGAAQGKLPLMLFYLNLNRQALPSLAAGQAVEMEYGQYTFSGSTDDLVLLYHNPPACLRLLDPQLDAYFTPLPGQLQRALARSNLGRILPSPGSEAEPPGPLRKPAGEAQAGGLGWCYYYEKADLARQTGDWEGAAALGLEAGRGDLAPQNEAERAPFILAFAHTSRWELARQWSLAAWEESPWTGELLCSLWETIEAEAPESPEKLQALGEVRGELGCEGQ